MADHLARIRVNLLDPERLFDYHVGVFDLDQLTRTVAQVCDLAGTDLNGLDPETLGLVALDARRLRELADHLEVHALGAMERSGHPEVTGLNTITGWFSHHARLPTAVGRAQVKTARALQELPGTDRAWSDGRITRQHVDVLAHAANPRIRHLIAGAEAELIGVSEDRTFERWKVKVRETVERLDDEGPDPDRPEHTSASWSRSGLFAKLAAQFAGADVELFEQVVEAHTNRLHRLHAEERALTPDLPQRTRNQLRGLALIDLVLHGPDHAVVDDHLDVHEAAERRARRTKATAKGMRVDVSLIIRPTEPDPVLPQLNDDVLWSVFNPAGEHLAFEHISSLLCDCAIHPLLVDHDDNPLNLGRSERLATPTQRRAVVARDGGCAFAGCDCPVAWVEVHHVWWWRHGGRTDIANLAALCRRHHGITHRRGWSMHASDDGWFWWSTPSGDTFWGQRHGTRRAGPTPGREPAAA